ncbi:MAG: hypothetical protein ACRD4I_12935 [Candidatus Angelobacter sp.]
MAEFRFGATEVLKGSRERRIRLALWGAVIALLAIALFTFHGAPSAIPQLNTVLMWLAGFIVAGAIVSAYFLAFRRGIEKVEHDLAFVLTDSDLIRKRSGYPDVQIDLSRINAIYERHAWLVVESLEPYKKIAIPKEIDGFGSLREELGKHKPIIVSQRPHWVWFIPTAAYLLCWALVLWSKNPRIMIVSGIIGFVLLGWESFRFCRQLRRSKNWVSLLPLGLSWLGAILVVYFRVSQS